jgi:hypothetical protein
MAECFLICHWVDRKMPDDHAGRFCILAMGLAEGFMVVVAAMAYGTIDTVSFDGSGKVFHGLSHFRCCPALTISEKMTLIESDIVSK